MNLQSQENKINRHKLFTAALMVFISIFFLFVYRSDLSKGPDGIHTWAQADHYALAKGFVNNDLDFFHPETYVCNHQFPDYWKTPREASVTAVDFPLHNYIPAVFMKLTGSGSPAIYRIYMLLAGITGLFFLFRLANMFSGNNLSAALVVIFFMSSPVFTYYQIRFLPGIPSLSTVIIGLYFYFRYKKEGRRKQLMLAVGFLTLSALTRTTFLIPLVAVAAVEFFSLFKTGKDLLLKIVLVSASAGLICGYFLWNAHLRSQYGSLFLSILMPVSSFREFLEITAKAYNQWRFEYFTIWHYAALLLAGISAFAARFVLRKKRFSEIRVPLLLTGFMLIGCLLFYIVLCAQFINHDYYFTDVFFVPVILIVCMLTVYLRPEKKAWKITGAAVGIALAVLMLYQDVMTQEQRRESEKFGINEATAAAYKESAGFLDRNGVSRNEKILVITPVSPNIPFMAMERKGFMTMSATSEVLPIMLGFPGKYVVFQNDLFMTEVYNNFPEIINRLEVMATNGKITLCRKTSLQKNDLLSFLGVKNKKPVYFAAFSDTANSGWRSARTFGSERKAWKFSSNDDFGPVLKINDEALFRSGKLMLIEGEISRDKEQDVTFCYSILNNGEFTLYKPFSMKKVTGGKSGWNTFRFVAYIPAANAGQVEFSADFVNYDRTEFFIRNLKCSLY